MLSLGVLYLFAVLPVAVFYGLGWALAVSIASMLAFNFFFLPPLHTLALTDSGNWVALAVFVVTSVVVSELSTRARRRSFAAAEADALRRSDAAKTAVLHAVSHDLRSPLTAIRVAAGGLESGTLALDADDRAALLETIRLETARLERLVANLLDLSRLEAGVAPAHRELWPVDELVSRALEALGADAARIEVALDGEAPLVRVDAAPARARARERARERAAVLLARGSGRARREQHGRRRARDDRRPRPRSRLRRAWSGSSSPSSTAAPAGRGPAWASRSPAGSRRPTAVGSGRSTVRDLAPRSRSHCRRPRPGPRSSDERRAGARRRRRAADPARAPDQPARGRVPGHDRVNGSGGTERGCDAPARRRHPRPRAPGRQRCRRLPRAPFLELGARARALGRRRREGEGRGARRRR